MPSTAPSIIATTERSIPGPMKLTYGASVLHLPDGRFELQVLTVWGVSEGIRDEAVETLDRFRCDSLGDLEYTAKPRIDRTALNVARNAIYDAQDALG